MSNSFCATCDVRQEPRIFNPFRSIKRVLSRYNTENQLSSYKKAQEQQQQPQPQQQITLKKNETTNLSNLELLRKYLPTFCFHSKESFFPCSIEHLIRYSHLLDTKNNQKKVEWNDILSSINDPKHKNLDIKVDSNGYCGENASKNGNHTTVYGYVETFPQEPEIIVVHYILLFARTGANNLPTVWGYSFDQPGQAGAYDGGIRHCALRIDKRTTFITGVQLNDDKIWHPTSEFSLSHNNTTCLIFVSINSHQLFHSSGTFVKDIFKFEFTDHQLQNMMTQQECKIVEIPNPADNTKTAHWSQFQGYLANSGTIRNFIHLRWISLQPK